MAKEPLSAGDADDLVAQIDTGARNPENWQGKFIVTVAFIWALFQLYIASNLPFYLTELTRVSVIVTKTSPLSYSTP